MLSIIIASANPLLLEQVKKNISETVGVPFEILAFENANGKKGICQLYNQGIDKAQYNILCFMHEDIAIETAGWGAVIGNLFTLQPTIGVIGIAGSTYKSIMPTGWSCIGMPGGERAYHIQSFKYIEKERFLANVNPNNESLARVVAVDGMWMCVRKEVAARFRFDSKTFSRFHCYDLDFCLAAGKEVEIAVTYEVLLNHFSEGKFDREWMEQTLLLFDKWEKNLPRSVTPLSKKMIRAVEKRNFLNWLEQLRSLEMDEAIAYRVLRRRHMREVLGLKYFLKFYYIVFARIHFKKKPVAGADL